ncbi:MAG: Hpt domain-containing protein [Rhodospirillaceae bacterium]|nr:MAG: Hpt domain-containing protein [Rhodospirillaceae bacterium]
MTAKPVEFIQPPNNLRNKQKLAGVSMSFDGGILDQAEAAIRRSSDDYFTSIAEDLVKLQRIYEASVAEPGKRASHVEDLHGVAQAIAGQGSSFGYPLITGLGSQLCHYIEDHLFPLAGERIPTEAELEVIKVHMEAMRLVIQQKMEGDGGPVGQKLVSGLAMVIKKVTAPPSFKIE